LTPKWTNQHIVNSEHKYVQDAQLSQRESAAGYISFGRKWKTGTQRQYFTDIVSLASTTVT